MKKSKIIVAALLLTAIPATAGAANYVLGHSAVDDGEIRWGGSTKYTSERSHSHSLWNGLNRIDVLPDSTWTYEDVTYGDVNRSDVTWMGQYTYWGALTDNIDYNDYYFQNMTWEERTKTVTHELGHAHGLDHSYQPNVMASGPLPYTQLGDQDKQDYYYLWN